MAVPPLDVRLSRDDGATWTDVTSHVAATGLRCIRGRSRSQGQWVPGSLTLTLLNHTGALDPTNDDAVWRLRPGDLIGIRFDGLGAWFGRIDSVVAAYRPGGDGVPFSTLTISATDGLGILATAAGTEVGGATPALSSDAINYALTAAGVNYSGGINVAAGVVTVSQADYAPQSPTNALAFIQKVTATEGGAARLFMRRTGSIRWIGRQWEAPAIRDFGTGGIPITDIQVDSVNADWANRVELAPGEHSDSFTSSTSVVNGVGRKTFTVGGAASRMSVGCDVRIVSGAGGNTMSGKVASYDGTSMVCDIASATGTATRADWTLTTTERGTTQLFTSSTSVTNGTGSKSFTVPSGLTLPPGTPIQIVSTGSANAMVGTVTSYSGTSLVVEVTTATGTGTRTDWSLCTTLAGFVGVGAEQDSFDTHLRWQTMSQSTLHTTRTRAAAEAELRAADLAWPARMISMVEVELGHPDATPSMVESMLQADIGDAASVKFPRGVGSPSTLWQVRLIDAVEHIRTAVSHRIRFYLGQAATMNYTALLKQNNATISVSSSSYQYTVQDGWVVGFFDCTPSAAGTTNTEIKITPTGLPAPISVGAGLSVGGFCYNDNGVRYHGNVTWDGTDLRFFVHNASTPLGQTPNFAIASTGDRLSGSFRFRAA